MVVILLFNSFAFLCFFPMVTAFFWVIPRKFRKLWLLFSSFVFILSESIYSCKVLILVSGLSFLFGIILDRTEGKKKKIVFYISIIACLMPLIILKYQNFLPFLIKKDNDPLKSNSLVTPIGISFYTLQAIGYLIDVYKKEGKAVYNIADYALYLSFFPKFLSGPLVCEQDFFEQTRKIVNGKFNETKMKSGAILMMWGYFLKIILADNLSVLVTRIYDFGDAYSGTVILVGTFLFAIQLYADFAGYSYIAIGASQILGYRLKNNFRQPYFATSINDFWRRWHISLSLWLRKYIYIPLGGNRAGRYQKYKNILITFFVSGLWHGASWNFVAWGMLHGLYQILEDCLKNVEKKYLILRGKKKIISEIIQRICVIILVVFAWIFFRASGLKTALRMLIKVITDMDFRNFFDGTFLMLGLSGYELIILTISVIVLFAVDILHEKNKSIQIWLNRKSRLFRWCCYLITLFILFIAAVRRFGSEASGFIYSQF